MRLLIYFTCSTIVLLGAKQNSWFSGTGLPIEVKRTVGPVARLDGGKLGHRSVCESNEDTVMFRGLKQSVTA